MSTFLRAGLYQNLSNNYEHKFSGGRFSILNSSTINVAAGGSNYFADLKSLESFQFAGKKKELEIKYGHSEYAGINKKFITSDGLYDTALAMVEFSRTSTERRMIKEDSLALLKAHTQCDSHELFIYNMLISWFKAYLYAGQDVKDGILRVSTDAYVDTHAIVHLDQEAVDHTYQIKMCAPCDVDHVLGENWEYRTPLNAWAYPMVVKFSATTKAQEYFYLSHLSGRTNASELNFDFNFVGIRRGDVALERVGGGFTIFDDEPDIDWTARDLMWQWILDYVHVNRLEQQFAATFEAILVMGAHPTHHTMESTAWHAAPLKLVLPAFCPTRAKISLALEGEAFTPAASPHDFMLTDGRAPTQCVLSAAITNYYMWLGIYALVENQARAVVDWHYAFLCNDETTDVLASPYAKAAAASFVTGREYTTMMYDGCHARIKIEEMVNVNHIYVSSSPDGSVPSKVRLEYVPSTVSGGLVNGTITDTVDVLSHLTALQVLKRGDVHDMSKSFRTVLRLSNLYREFGHDVVWERNRGQDDLKPYSSSSTCIIDPYSMGFNADRDYSVEGGYSVERAGRHNIIPSLAVMMDMETIGVQKLKPTLTVVAWKDRRTPLRPTRRTARLPVKTVFKIATGSALNRTLLRSLKAMPGQQDFRKSGAVIAPLLPTDSTEGPLISVDTVATTDDA
jgi:hypothetical protein